MSAGKWQEKQRGCKEKSRERKATREIQINITVILHLKGEFSCKISVCKPFTEK